MALELVTPPTVEPISLAEAKAHLRVEVDDDDTLIGRLIAVARQDAERHQRRALLPQSFDLTLGDWPRCDRTIKVPRPPLIEVESIKYRDGDGVLQTLDETSYAVITIGTPGLIWFPMATSFPVLQCGRPDAITIRFEAGYADASAVPDITKQGMMMLIGHLYENREAVVTGTIATDLPMSVQFLLDAFATGDYP
jgi:uncharacterized phiE125 gp8 family phage protein